MVLRSLVLVGILLAGGALAAAEIECDVQEDGSYRAITRSVQFVTGSELNTATRSFDFNSFSVYALLWFAQDQVAILEHDGIAVGVTGDFDFDDLERLFRVFGYADFTQVNGADRQYEITCRRIGGRWVDSRMN